MTRALLVYASLTGNTEEIIRILGEALTEVGVVVEIKECTEVDPIAFKDVDICVVGSYTYGADGNLPDEIVDFYDELGTLDLTGKTYASLGSGEEFYGHFCQSADDFDIQFSKTKAVKGAEVVKIEEAPGADDMKKIFQCAKSLLETVKNNAAKD